MDAVLFDAKEHDDDEAGGGVLPMTIDVSC
jgi:hypothetical protein